MKKIEYQTLFPHPLSTGDVVKIQPHNEKGEPVGTEAKSWDCVIPCRVVGALLVSGHPVIASDNGPKVAQGELIPVGHLRTKGKPGQTPLEVMTLGAYKRICPADMHHRRIVDAKYTSDEFILIDEDRNYVKLVPSEGQYDEGMHFESEDLTMADLKAFGHISKQDWEQYGQQQGVARDAAFRRQGRRLLDKAIQILGPTAVKELVTKTKIHAGE